VVPVDFGGVLVGDLLVLWDVDGTLLNAGGVGGDLYNRVFWSMFGRPCAAIPSMAGRTDRAIILDTLEMAGVPEPRRHVDPFIEGLRAHSQSVLQAIQEQGHALPGAAEAIAAIASATVAAGAIGFAVPGVALPPEAIAPREAAADIAVTVVSPPDGVAPAPRKRREVRRGLPEVASLPADSARITAASLPADSARITASALIAAASAPFGAPAPATAPVAAAASASAAAAAGAGPLAVPLGGLATAGHGLTGLGSAGPGPLHAPLTALVPPTAAPPAVRPAPMFPAPAHPAPAHPAPAHPAPAHPRAAAGFPVSSFPISGGGRGTRPSRVHQSVLTGNVRPLAEVKLDAVGLRHPLDLCIGAYGDDHEIRTELVHLARRRAAGVYGRSGRDFAGEATIVVGDTPMDIEAALAAGARAVGVATGPYSADELRAAGAHAVLDDLTSTPAVLTALLSQRS
jgi:phosphoglycolate phosphatase-like HAD superfamily hydrolase